MANIHIILAEINKSNSTNHKLETLKKYKDDEFLKKVLKMAYDRVAYTYGVTPKQIDKFKPQKFDLIPITLKWALNNIAYNLCGREKTGNDALQYAANVMGSLSHEDAQLLRKILNRDLRLNIGKTVINKVWKGLITKPVYMRCDVYNEKTASNIKFPAYVQLKADGTYREFSVMNGLVSAKSRSGEIYDYPLLFEYMSKFPDGIYTGELTVRGIKDRAKGNGLLNSDEVPHEDIILELWDYITHDEYQIASTKNKKNPCHTPYCYRFVNLKSILSKYGNDQVKLIPCDKVHNIQEALEITSNYMNEGFEGAILKDWWGVFKDGTSKHQLKLKIKIDCEMRITGFTEGNGKNINYFGAVTFQNDEGTIKGKVGVSTMSEKLRDWFHANRDEVIGKVMTVQFNDLSKAIGNDYYALSHPRFIELRNDKDETDTLQRVFDLRNMAIKLKQ